MASEKFEEWTTPESLALITGMCREGCTNKMLAQRIGIGIDTFYKWMRKSNELKEAVRQGKEVADYMVENALFKAAIGFEHTETKTYITGQPDKKGNRNVRVEKTVKYFPPNTTAMIMWLCNRKPEQWKRNRDNAFELSDEENRITVNIVKSSEARRREKEALEEREKEGIKTEEVDPEEFKGYQSGYAEEGEEDDELEERSGNVGLNTEAENEWDG